MKILPFLLTTLAVVPAVSFCQIHAETSDYATRILPYSIVRPATTILPGSIITDQLECATVEADTADFFAQPWVGNNQYLSHLLSGLGYPVNAPNVRVEQGNQVRYKIPVKFWVYRNSDGTGDVDLTDIQIWMDSLNHYFRINNTGIRLYQLEEVEFINNTNLTSVGKLAEVGNWINGRHVNRAANVHVVNDIKNAAGYFTIFPKRAIFLQTGGFGATRVNSSTMVHEMGHLLGLFHTHQFYKFRGWPFENCLVEPVDRYRTFAFSTLCNPYLLFVGKRKCELTGDGLCDTPADPIITTNDHSNCQWNANHHANDIYGDSYTNPPSGSQSPNVRNFMAYGNHACRSQFSYSQIGVMIHSIESPLGGNYARKNEWTDPSVVFDTFEPDNSFVTRRNLPLNDVQHHTFHTEYSGALYNDTDWLDFTVTESGLFYTIKTLAVAGQPSADTEIRLYAIHENIPTLLTSNDNAGASTYSQIQQTLAAGQYAVEVVNKMPSAAGHYNIVLYNCADPQALAITGPSHVCSTNTSFSLVGVPSGAAIAWQHSGNVLYVAGQGTASFTVRSSGSGSGFVSATVCGNITVPQKTFQVGTPQFSNAHIRGVPYTGSPVSLCPGSHWLGASAEGASISWMVPFPHVVTGSGTYVDFTLPSSFSSTTITASANNTCGVSTLAFYIQRAAYCPSGYSMNAYPNPAEDELTVEWAELDSLGAQYDASSEKMETDYEIVLYNAQRTKVFEAQTKKRVLKIPVRNLPPGYYYLNVLSKEATLQKQILIERK